MLIILFCYLLFLVTKLLITDAENCFTTETSEKVFIFQIKM